MILEGGTNILSYMYLMFIYGTMYDIIVNTVNIQRCLNTLRLLFIRTLSKGKNVKKRPFFLLKLQNKVNFASRNYCGD